MPTPSEQKALAFVSIVIVLGGAVRALRAGAPATATLAEQQAIARQAYATESASMRDTKAKKGRKGLRVAQERRDTGVSALLSPLGYPPPSPRIDVDYRLSGGMVVVGAPATTGGGNSRAKGASARTGPMDLDVASAAEIQALPRVGPALAARIVASRDSNGPFGSLEALRRVRGVGPAMLRQLGPLVTFSGRAASFDVRPRY